MWSNIFLLQNSKMMYRHPQFPLLESYWDNKYRGRLIANDGEVSAIYYFYTDFVNMF
jgi:hypothetical protein